MFWTRSTREARRQEILDELLEIDPEKRRWRLDIAVAAGELKRKEVETALILVKRLDALRVMTIPPSDYLPGGIESVVPLGTKAAELPTTPKAQPGLEGQAAGAILVVGDFGAATRWPGSAPRPSEASAKGRRRHHSPLAARAIKPEGIRATPAATAPTTSAPASATPAAVPSAAPTSSGALTSRGGGQRTADAQGATSSPPLARRMTVQTAVPMGDDPADKPRREESWPSISWLRP